MQMFDVQSYHANVRCSKFSCKCLMVKVIMQREMWHCSSGALPIEVSSLEMPTISLNRAPAYSPEHFFQTVYRLYLWPSSSESECKITLFSCFVPLFLLVKSPKLDVVTLFASFFGVRPPAPKKGDWRTPHRDQLMMKCKKCWIFDSDICHVSKTWYLHVD